MHHMVSKVRPEVMGPEVSVMHICMLPLLLHCFILVVLLTLVLLLCCSGCPRSPCCMWEIIRARVRTNVIWRRPY